LKDLKVRFEEARENYAAAKRQGTSGNAAAQVHMAQLAQFVEQRLNPNSSYKWRRSPSTVVR